MSSKYVDPTAIVQVIGCVYKNPSLLDLKDKYVISEQDFVEKFHRIVFGAIYNLYLSGLKEININNVVDFLDTKPKSKAIFDANNGVEYLAKLETYANPASFGYYYDRMKKMSLLRAYDNIGVDVSDIYDADNFLDIAKLERQNAFLENATLLDIADIVDEKIADVRSEYVSEVDHYANQAGEGVLDLIERLKESPEVGLPLYGSMINTICQGARLKKFYLRSALTGYGKSRTLVGDACYLACEKIFEIKENDWVINNAPVSVLFIATEQDLEEIQTLALSFISSVDEEHILMGKYLPGEYERVVEAGKVLKNSSLFIVETPDFSLEDIENIIRQNVRDHECRYIMFDYIMTSMKILEEITRRSGGVRLREDNVLFMLSVRLKDLCNKYGIFIMSSTQLSGDVDNTTPDQRLLRGAKSIADKIDVGMMLLPVTDNDLKALQSVCNENGFDIPDIKMSVYKNRRGKHKAIYLWGKRHLGVCRIDWYMATTWRYELTKIDNLNIKVRPSAF